jgi:hypothetical protein
MDFQYVLDEDNDPGSALHILNALIDSTYSSNYYRIPDVHRVDTTKIRLRLQTFRDCSSLLSNYCFFGSEGGWA